MAATRQSSSAALIAMAGVVITSFVVAALYVGREILIPLALAALLSFLLAPLVTRLERWLGRIGATLAAVAILFGFIGGIGWVLTHEVIELVDRLPSFQGNIQEKLKKLKVPGGGRFSRLSKTVDEIKKDLPTDDAPATEETVAVVSPKPPGAGLPKAPASAATPTPVEIVETKHKGSLEQLGTMASPLINPLGTAALVLLLLVCMLLQREDLRGRLIRLVGQGNISATTRAMDDAAARISRYLLMQLVVNATYGLAIGVGLYFIGVPSPFVWGVLATVLRFIPYVGAWIASAFPLILSLAASTSWTPFLLTVALFVVIELISNNVMEPMLYGSSTGVSAIALIIAAVFWTWLWGAAGLVLATPLTVCLVVMGRHVPRLSALSVLLSDEEALAAHEEFYHRLLTPNANDAIDFAHTFLKTGTLTSLYDTVMIPVLAAVESDLRTGKLEAEQHDGIQQEMQDVIEDLGTNPLAAPAAAETTPNEGEEGVAPPPVVAPNITYRVLCLPVRAERDEIAGTMLAQILASQEFPVTNVSSEKTTGELLEAVEQEGAEAVCISVAPPSTVVHARYLSGKLRARFSNLHIVIGLWGVTDQLTEHTQRLKESGADEVVNSFGDAAAHLAKHATALAQEVFLLSPGPEEPERLAALAGLHLLDTEPEPAFDAITNKVARILNMPIALITFVDQDRQFFKSQFGLPEDLALARQTPRDVSVCAHVVANNEVVVVEDLARDRRFSKSAMLKEHGFRSYAGAPLRTAGGFVLGSLCVLDRKPRQFGPADKRLLQAMAEEVMEAVNLRSQKRQAEGVDPALPAVAV